MSFTLGRYGISAGELIKILFGKLFGLKRTWPETVETVLFSVRIP
jgi:iron complex transport system permease protein